MNIAFSEIELNRMAQRFYEAGGTEVTHMSDKPRVVEALRVALSSAIDRYTVELGNQRFTEEQWGVIQAYAKGYAISAEMEADTGMQEGVRAFHRAMGHTAPDHIQPMPEADIPLVIELIREEFADELIPALYAHDMVETVDALIDILYVTFGALVRMGVDAKPLFDEVQRSNMSKLGPDGKGIIAGPNDPDGVFEGRVKKGPNYFRPNLAGVLDDMIRAEQPTPVAD